MLIAVFLAGLTKVLRPCLVQQGRHTAPRIVGHSVGVPVNLGRYLHETMKRRYAQFNPKRRLLTPVEAQARAGELQKLADRARYGGNPEHKKNPGDFGLTPPSDPRQGKSLCDSAKVFKRTEAEVLLKAGLRHGLVSDRMDGEWPKNVWSVTEAGIPMEAQLENPEMGAYHGYPMPETDPLSQEVLRRWERIHG